MRVFYIYDNNGNITKDPRKNLELSYNSLNLLSEVKQGSSIKAKYVYASDGTKLGVKGIDGKGYYYRGSLIYSRNGSVASLESVGFSDGRIVKTSSGYDVNYQLTDHLGSVRVLFSQNGALVAQNDYYPFGGRHSNSQSTNNTSNRFKYNGKEEQTTDDVGYLDYGARMYDDYLGRWFGQDPMAEKYHSQSQYSFCLNNPIRLIDPNGEDIFMYFYVNGHNKPEDDRMFWISALTRAFDMLKNGQIGDGDIYKVIGISDLGKLGDAVEDVVSKYSATFGKTAEFGLWSHGALDGPMGSIESSSFKIGNGKQMSIEGWSKINFNWKDDGYGATAMFFGCRTASSENGTVIPWAQKVSENSNMKNVNVMGQTKRSWPSKYPDGGVTTSDMLNNIHKYPTYMVGGDQKFTSKLHRNLGIGNWSYPMAIYQDGTLLRKQQQSYRSNKKQ